MKNFLSLAALAFISTGCFAQNFYDASTVQEIRIYFTQTNWDQMLDTAEAGSDSYIMADSIKINGTTIRQVGVKYKGNSSYNPTQVKNPFHIELDTYIPQDYQGFMINSFRGEYSFLSNFHSCVIEYEGFTYKSSEAAYQSAKFQTRESKLSLTFATAAESKRAGATAKKPENWDVIKLKVMEDILNLKFAKEPFRSWLLATGDQEIVEGNNWGDRFWGVCDGEGQNHLGRLLMKIRAKIKEGNSNE
jgi:ribA/ribD-fused uncharacterized protein